jgi:hypothetical protein
VASQLLKSRLLRAHSNVHLWKSPLRLADAAKVLIPLDRRDVEVAWHASGAAVRASA